MWDLISAGKYEANGKKVDKGFPVVVTSYETLMIDLKLLQQFHWRYLVLDEGHRIKNWNCKLIKDLKSLPSEDKLLLTGELSMNHSLCIGYK